MNLIKTTTPIARKEHMCEYCGHPIKKGERYVYKSFVDSAGNFSNKKYHEACNAAMEKLAEDSSSTSINEKKSSRLYNLVKYFCNMFKY